MAAAAVCPRSDSRPDSLPGEGCPGESAAGGAIWEKEPWVLLEEGVRCCMDGTVGGADADGDRNRDAEEADCSSAGPGAEAAGEKSSARPSMTTETCDGEMSSNCPSQREMEARVVVVVAAAAGVASPW